MATVSLAWKPEDLFVQFKKPKDRTMDKFEQDFNNACKILSPEGEPPKPYFNRGRFDGSDWQNVAHGACLSDTGDDTYQQLTKPACDWLGSEIIMVN